MAATPRHPPHDPADDEPENFSFRRDDNAPDDTDLASNDLESVDLVECPRCHKYCLRDYAHCPRCQAALAAATVNRKPLWYLLTFAIILGLVLAFWILQNYAPPHRN
ncbi:MAG: hypothetical protein WCI73_07715 [Phycisphaerae bacterium]